MTHVTKADIEAALDDIRRSPADSGTLAMIVRRPKVNERETLDTGELDLADGLVGDTWKRRKDHRTHESPHPDTQLNVMNARVIAALAGDRARWPLAGDQLYVDFDLSEHNAPPGTQLAIGSAVIEVTEEPHTGCAKFTSRFGAEATQFVNSPVGRALRMRGINAKVVQAGTVAVGDTIRKIAAGESG